MPEGFDYGKKLPDGQHERHPTQVPADRGFVRPVRRSYKHVGIRPQGAIRPLSDEEREEFKTVGYVAFEPYGADRTPAALGRYWTQRQLDSGCGVVTTMGQAIAETYAANPHFYGSTFCCGCHDYYPVGKDGEFVWVENDGTLSDQKVGT